MRTAAAWKTPCGGCFLWAGGGPYELRLPIFLRPLGGGCFCPAGREAPGRSCSHPPARVRLTFAQKKTASVSLHQRFFHGRGWITQAAHLKRSRRGLFAAGTYSGGPYELRLPIFLQPLGGALKNRSAAPASPPCFRRRRRSAPLLFESTLESETSVFL